MLIAESLGQQLELAARFPNPFPASPMPGAAMSSEAAETVLQHHRFGPSPFPPVWRLEPPNPRARSRQVFFFVFFVFFTERESTIRILAEIAKVEAGMAAETARQRANRRVGSCRILNLAL